VQDRASVADAMGLTVEIDDGSPNMTAI